MVGKKIEGMKKFFKRSIKALLPHGVIVLLRKYHFLKEPGVKVVYKEVVKQAPKTKLEDIRDFDNLIFENGYSHGEMSRENLEGWMLFCAHALEKAMSREEFEAGHGSRRLQQLRGFLDTYERKGFSKDSFAYTYALSSIKSFVEVHNEHNLSINEISDIVGESKLNESLAVKQKLAGYTYIHSDAKKNNKELSYDHLIQNRFSVRDFSKKKPSITLLRQAIDMSMKAPSICNRQGARVYIVTNKQKIKDILEIQGGFGGYELPPYLLTITFETQTLVDLKERNQGFIDGGLFSMTLLLSLEYLGLAVCSLNAMFRPDADKSLRSIIGVGMTEYFIMFMAVGNFKDATKVAISSRQSGREITKEIV